MMSIFAYFGMVLFVLVVFQVLSGRRTIPVDFIWHRRNGVLILVVAVCKGLLAILVNVL